MCVGGGGVGPHVSPLDPPMLTSSERIRELNTYYKNTLVIGQMILFNSCPTFLSFFLSFFLYILPDPLSNIIGRCALYTPGCRKKAYK